PEPAGGEGQAARRERLSGQPEGGDGDRSGAAQSGRSAGPAGTGGAIGLAARGAGGGQRRQRPVKRALWIAVAILAFLGVSSAVSRAVAVIDPDGAVVRAQRQFFRAINDD